MNKVCGATAMVIALGFAAPAGAASEIDCKVMWSKADPNDSGHISGDRAVIYMEAMMTSGRATAAVDRIAVEEFMAACMADVFKNANT